MQAVVPERPDPKKKSKAGKVEKPSEPLHGDGYV